MKFGPVDTSKCVITDFETYYDDEITLRNMRQEEYILHPKFKVHGVAVATPRGKVDFVVEKDIPKWLKANKKMTFVNHKMIFDGLIWKLKYGFSAPLWVDTLSMSNAVFGPAEVSGGNDLETVSVRLGLQPKGKIEAFKGRRDLTKEEAAALAIYATNDADLTYKTFHALLPHISRPEFEFWLMDHTLRVYFDKPLPVEAKVASSTIIKVQERLSSRLAEMPKITFNFKWQKKYKRKAGTFIEEKVTRLNVDAAVLGSNKQFPQALKAVLEETKTPVPMKRGKKGMIPALAKDDEGFLALLQSTSKKVRTLVKARLVKKSGDTQIARLRTLLLTSSLGGFRVYLTYWGAGTGRWSGGSGLNPQNFPNPTRSPDEFEREVAALIRACVTAGKGKVFVAVDAANIEARILAWWAGERELVEQFGRNIDVYSTFASKAFGEEVRKPKDGDEPKKARRFKLLRNVGKSSVLGLGFGMGNTARAGQKYGKFEMNLRKNPDVNPLFQSGELDTGKVNALLHQYREKYTGIVALWGKVEAAFATAYGGAKRMVNGVLFEHYRALNGGQGVRVTLPSGRAINYPDVRQGLREGATRKQWMYGQGRGKPIYGSLLAENIVQAMARDILAEGVWSMEKAGFPVSYHVHDSIVCATTKKEAQDCLNTCIEVLSAAPEWGQGMMLGAEGTIEETFA